MVLYKASVVGGFMQYGYKDANYEELIKGYFIFENDFVVHYLDGSADIFPITNHNIDVIYNKMIEQAKERDKKSYELTKNSISKCTFLLISRAIVSTLALSYSFVITSFNTKIILLLGGTILGMATLLYAFVLSQLKRKNNELEKYNIYLNMREELEEKNLWAININTIDEYSLEEVKKLKKFLETDDYKIENDEKLLIKKNTYL